MTTMAPESAPIRLWAMGQCTIEVGGVLICPAAQMRFATALYLTIERGKRVHRAELAELMWPSAPDVKRRHSLRHLIYKLRMFGAPIVERDQYLQFSAADVQLDYEDLLGSDPSSVANVRTFLPGYSPCFSPAYSEWVDRTRDEVHARLRPFLLVGLATLRSHAKWTEMDCAARQYLQIDPLNEEATLALAEATALSGNKAAAIRILDRFLQDLEAGPHEIRVPANVLRRRISERLPEPYSSSAESCFVGREQTLALLSKQLHQAKSGRGCGLYVWGGAGMGKTRLALELTKLAALDGVTAHRIVCQPADERAPLSISSEIARRLLELPGALGCAPQSRECLLRLTGQGDARGSGSPQGATNIDDSTLVQARVRHALMDLVDAVCDEKPLLLVIEDVLSLDPASADVIRAILTRISRTRLCLVITARALPPGGSSLAVSWDGLRIHQLLPLAAEEAARLFVAFCSGSSRVPDPASIQRCVSVAEGNPLAIRELAEHWAGGGAPTSLPESIRESLDQRLAILDSRSLRVLQACALLGANATLDRLERILDYPKGDLLDCLDALDGHSVLLSDGEYIRTKHALLSEAASAKLSTTGARYLHRRIAVVLESDLDRERGGPMLWECADHYERAGEVDRALELVARFADYAVQAGSLQEAVQIWDRASTITGSQGRMKPIVQGRLIASLRAAGLWTRVLMAAREDAPEASDENAPHVHDDAELAVIEAQWQTCHATTPLLRHAMRCLQDASASPEHRAEAGVWALIFSHNLPHPASAREAIATIRALPMRHTHLRNQIVADLVYNTAFGDLKSGALAGMRLVRTCRESNHLPLVCRGLRQAAIPFLYLGEFATARDLLLEALAAAESMCLTATAAATTVLLARSYLEEGDIAAAKDWHARSVDYIAAAPEQVRPILDVPFVGAQIAVLENRLGARELTEFPPSSHWLGVESSRVHSMALAVLALGQIQSDQPFADSYLFRQVFQEARNTGCQDFAAYAMFRLERASGPDGRARDLLEHYLRTSRRERSPLPPFLSKIRS